MMPEGVDALKLAASLSFQRSAYYGTDTISFPPGLSLTSADCISSVVLKSRKSSPREDLVTTIDLVALSAERQE